MARPVGDGGAELPERSATSGLRAGTSGAHEAGLMRCGSRDFFRKIFQAGTQQHGRKTGIILTFRHRESLKLFMLGADGDNVINFNQIILVCGHFAIFLFAR